MPCAMFLRFREEMRSVSGLALARHAMMVLWQNNKHQPDNPVRTQAWACEVKLHVHAYGKGHKRKLLA